MVSICLLNSIKTRKMSGLQIDIYLYQKYLNADLYFIGNRHIYKNQEIVILSRVIVSDVTLGYYKYANKIVISVNNINIKNNKLLIIS